LAAAVSFCVAIFAIYKSKGLLYMRVLELDASCSRDAWAEIFLESRKRKPQVSGSAEAAVSKGMRKKGLRICSINTAFTEMGWYR